MKVMPSRWRQNSFLTTSEDPSKYRAHLGRPCRFTLVCLLLSTFGSVTASAANSYSAAQSAGLSLRSPWNTNWAVGDLNGDKWPDSVRAEMSPGGGYRVRVGLSGSIEDHGFDVPVPNRSGLRVEARDLDGDHDLDLIITSGLAGQPVGLWINDGWGVFTEADTDLYSCEAWRESPSVGSTSVLLSDPSAAFESFSSSRPYQFYWLPEPRAARSLLLTDLCRCQSPFLSEGQRHVRPPPFLS